MVWLSKIWKKIRTTRNTTGSKYLRNVGSGPFPLPGEGRRWEEAQAKADETVSIINRLH